MLKFINACDKFRKIPANELIWHEMMNTAKKISEAEFLKSCNVYELLDEGEKWSEYKYTAKMQGDSIKFYKSLNGLYYFQHAGFEFIWG